MAVNKNEKSSRIWLNDDKGAPSFLLWKVARTRPFYVDTTFIISDCNRQISLDFSVYEKEDKKRVIKKINKIVDELYEFKMALEEAVDDVEIR